MEGDYVDATGRSKLAVALLGACALIAFVSILSSLLEIRLLGELEVNPVLAEPGGEWMARAESNDLRQMALGIVWMIVYFASAVTFIVWFHRAYKNLQALGGTTVHGPGWAIGSWFVPILNLFRPYKIMAEIWSATEVFPEDDDTMWRPSRTPGLFMAWWGVWIVNNVLSNIQVRLGIDGEGPADMIMLDWFGIVTNSLDVVGAGLAIGVVLSVTARQRRWYAHGSGQPLDIAQDQRF